MSQSIPPELLHALGTWKAPTDDIGVGAARWNCDCRYCRKERGQTNVTVRRRGESFNFLISDYLADCPFPMFESHVHGQLSLAADSLLGPDRWRRSRAALAHVIERGFRPVGARASIHFSDSRIVVNVIDDSIGLAVVLDAHTEGKTEGEIIESLWRARGMNWNLPTTGDPAS